MDRPLSPGAVALCAVPAIPGCEKEYSAAVEVIASYRKQFPNDQIFPVKAKAMVEYRRGSVREGLSIYEQSFQPSGIRGW